MLQFIWNALVKDEIWRQITAICVASMVSFTYGMLTAWSSPFLVKITQDKVNYNITEDEAFYFTLIPPITMVTFCSLFAQINDIFGRKRCLQLMTIPYILSFILSALAKNIYVFYLARFFAGIGDACHFSSMPMYIGEISTPIVRGTFGNCVSGFLFLGQFCINLIGQNYSVWVSSYICMTVPIAFLLISFYLPESPYFYIMKGKMEEAKKSLEMLRGKKGLNENFEQLKSDVERQLSEKGRFVDLFLIKTNRRAFTSGVFLRTSQQFAGITIFNVYVQYIFEKSGTNIDPKMSTLLVTGILAFATFIAGFTAESFGRVKTYFSSLLVCSLLLLANGIYFFLDQFTSVNMTSVFWMPLVFTIVYIAIAAFGIAMLPTLMLGEIFSTSIKSYGLSFLSLGLGALQFATNGIFFYLNTRFGLYAPFLFFGVCTVVSAVMAPCLVIETKGKTLEEIQQSLRKKNKTDEFKGAIDVAEKV